MNNKAVNFIRNFSYTLLSNFLSLLISTVIILVVPKIIGVEEYGYWQLYLFYSSYVGFFHFGWNDGIYLRYGGSEFDSLDKKKFFVQFHSLAIFQIGLAVIGLGIIGFLNLEPSKLIILQLTLLSMVLLNLGVMLLYILQSTNKIKEYARITLIDRVTYFILLITFLVLGFRKFEILIFADLIGKVVSLLAGMYFFRDIIFLKGVKFYFDLKETWENISVGIKLLFSNIASMLIIGIVRLGIENSWDVETFGKISLILSISNLLMVFVNALGLIMFPVLRRVSQNRLSSIYTTLRDFLMILMFAALIVYYPLKVILVAWLPQYAESLSYMALLFPIIIYEGKMSLLINTYLKTLREEKAMLRINLLTLVLSSMLTIVTTIIYRNLDFTVLSIVILLAFRCGISEFYISKLLNISVYKDILLELLITILFILTAWFIDSLSAVAIYAFVYIAYIFIKRNDIKYSRRNIKELLKANE